MGGDYNYDWGGCGGEGEMGGGSGRTYGKGGGDGDGRGMRNGGCKGIISRGWERGKCVCVGGGERRWHLPSSHALNVCC